MTNPVPIPPPLDSDKCYKCNKNPSNKILNKCRKCNKLTHMKCDKTTKSEIAHFLEHPDDFECKSCSTCRLCNRYVASNHRGIECTICNHWIHAKCNRLNDKDYDKFNSDETLTFQCMQCLKDTLPTLNLTPKELKLVMDGIDIPDEISSEDILLDDSQLELIEKINSAIKNGLSTDNDNDDDDSTSPVDCKYSTHPNIFPSFISMSIQLSDTSQSFKSLFKNLLNSNLTSSASLKVKFNLGLHLKLTSQSLAINLQKVCRQMLRKAEY